MRRFTYALITSTAALALSAAPALADHHEGDAMHDAAKKGEKVMTMDKSDMKDAAMQEGKDAVMHEGEMIKEKVMTEGDEMMDASKVNDTVGEVLQADGQPSPQMDGEILEYDGTVQTKDVLLNADDDPTLMDNTIVVPTVGGSEVLTTVNCPAGSTAQPDGTCMLSADGTLEYESTTVTMDSGMTNKGMMDSGMTTGTSSTGLYTTEGKPYKGTLNPAEAFGPNS